jgi:hypothetical protein
MFADFTNQEDRILDYEIVPVQTGKGQQCAAVRRKQWNEGQNQGDRDFSDSDMTEILAIANNEQELHEKVQKRSRKKVFGII